MLWIAIFRFLIEKRRGLLAKEKHFEKQKKHRELESGRSSRVSDSSSVLSRHPRRVDSIVSLLPHFNNRDTENERQKVREDKATVLIMEELVLEVTWDYAHQMATDFLSLHRYIPNKTKRAFIELAEMVSLKRNEGRQPGEAHYDDVTQKFEHLQGAKRHSRDVWSHSQTSESTSPS
ncbi:hypothetical protein LSAT2_022294 [Lamellibrachia satsuma]|nr:hypothetical protein LSAT2_022294 [Lamellibrachia satsuma]